MNFTGTYRISLDTDEYIAIESDLSQAFTSTVRVVYAFIFIGAILGNLLLITRIVRTRPLHRPSNILIANLAVSDILTALIIVPLHMDILFNGYLSTAIFGCKINLTHAVVFFP